MSSCCSHPASRRLVRALTSPLRASPSSPRRETYHTVRLSSSSRAVVGSGLAAPRPLGLHERPASVPCQKRASRHQLAKQWEMQRRTFLKLPDLGKLSPFGQSGGDRDGENTDGASHYKETKTLPYSAEELYDIVSNVDAYEEFIPYCQSSEVLGPAPRAGSAGSDGVEAVRAQLTVGFANFTESYVSIVEMKQGEWVKATASPDNPLFKLLTTTWRFSPASSGSSRIDFSLSYAFSNPIYGAVASQAFDRMAPKMMTAFEERCLDVYGRR